MPESEPIPQPKSLQVNVELSPDVVMMLDSLCTFFRKERWEVIEMALEHMAAEVKLITRTVQAMEEDEQEEEN